MSAAEDLRVEEGLGLSSCAFYLPANDNATPPTSRAGLWPSRCQGGASDARSEERGGGLTLGLQYFGKRYLNPYLGRWISADPLAIHAPGEADLNLYAYVSGAVLKAVDPIGLDKKGANTLDDFASWLSGATSVHGKDIDVQGAGGVVRYLATYENIHRYPSRDGVTGEYVSAYRAKKDGIEQGLYMDQRIFQEIGYLLSPTERPTLRKESVRLAIHESFHGYEDQMLRQNRAYRQLQFDAMENYKTQLGITDAQAGSVVKEANADYFAQRGAAYATAHAELMGAVAAESLSRTRYEEIKSSYNATLRELDKTTFETYYTTVEAEGHGSYRCRS